MDAARAVAAATSIAAALGLSADHAIVLHDSNKLTLRLLPCDVVARVAPVGQEIAAFEIDLALRIAASGGPVAALAAGVAPRVHERDGFAVTLWTYYPSSGPSEAAPAAYARALVELHASMRAVEVATPHFTDRVAEAQHIVDSRERTPAFADADRELLRATLREQRRAIEGRGRTQQLLHGEPHPGNVLATTSGLRFVDLETCSRGPVELDLAYVPEDVVEHYPDVDHELLRDCRKLVLAVVAAWRWDPGDQFPDGQRAARDLIGALRAGPPWPTLDTVMRGRQEPLP